MNSNSLDMFLRPLVTIITLLVVLSSGCSKTGTDTKPAPLPGTPTKPVAATTAPTTAPAGKWSCWSVANANPPRCITPGAIWFAAGAHIWRCDRKSSQIQVFSVMDGLPIEHGLARVTGASDERCVILVEGRCPDASYRGGWGPDEKPFIWDPKTGWAALPRPQTQRVIDIGFDPKDRLVGLLESRTSNVYEIAEFKDGKWTHLCAVPQMERLSSSLICLPDGFMLYGYGMKGAPAATQPRVLGRRVFGQPAGPFVFAFIPADAGDDLTKVKTSDWPALNKGIGDHPEYFLTGGKCLLLAGGGQHAADPVPSVALSRALCEMSSDGLRVVRNDAPNELYPGYDLKAGGVLAYRATEESDGFFTLRGEGEGVPEVKVPSAQISEFIPFRDPDGNYWAGSRRWDGKKWLDFKPDWQFPTEGGFATDSDRLQLDAAGKTWSIIDPEMPLWASNYDPAKHTAGLTVGGGGNAAEWQLVRQNGAKREVLRSVPIDQFPEAQSADGDWWTIGTAKTAPPKSEIVRITASGERRYPCEVANPIMARAPKGDMWALGLGVLIDGTGIGRVVGCRYDAKADAFVKGDPQEAFAVSIGNKKFSCVPNGSQPYCKSADGWHPFVTPFGPYQPTGFAFRGDCVLMEIRGVGVMEYNCKLDKWIRLVDGGGFCSYDSRGRRIIAGYNFVLAYEGDPWASVGADTDAAGRADTGDQATFDRLLKQLGDSNEKVCEDAEKAMGAAYDKFYRRIVTASDDASLSEMVRWRLKCVLYDNFLTPPPALFRTVHPLLTSVK